MNESREAELRPYKKIVVRMPNWIGDLVMATPVLEDLRAKWQDAKIVALVRGKGGELLKGNPHIDEIVSFERGGEKMVIRYLRREQFDFGLLMTNSFSSAWLFWHGNVRVRRGFFSLLRAPLLTENIPLPKNKDHQHLVVTYKHLIYSETTVTKPAIYIPREEKSIGKTIIGINPGAAYGTAKCWLPERFREVAERLVKEISYVEIVFFGDKVTGIGEGLPEGVKDLSGKTTLKDLAAKIGGLDVLLTNDSGPMHIAAALEVPLVALFGSTSDTVTGPYGGGRIIHKRVECSPCYHRVCPIDFRCMTRIEVDEVVKEIKRALLDKITIAEGPVGEAKEPGFATALPRAKKKIGTIILAGGKGRRLGIGRAKGLLEVGGKSLYKTLVGKAGERVAIMTSLATHEETRRHVSCDLFMTRSLPRLSEAYDESPEGNGALFSAFYASGLLKKWDDVDLISVIPVDNPLADPLDEELAGGCEELAVLAIAREEKMGALVEMNGRLHVQEYTELYGEWKLGYTGIFMCTKEFFKKAAAVDLPYHKVVKEGTIHYEKFVFDAFPLANRYKILLKAKELCFSPIKTKADIELAEKILYTRCQ